MTHWKATKLNTLYPRPAGRTSAHEPAHEPAHEKLVTIDVAADYLCLSKSWLYERGDRAGIPVHRFGRQRRYRLSELAPHRGSAA